MSILHFCSLQSEINFIEVDAVPGPQPPRRVRPFARSSTRGRAVGKLHASSMARVGEATCALLWRCRFCRLEAGARDR